MHATELRIGNFIYYHGVVVPFTIGMQIEIAEPIPLNEEWLEEFGFWKRITGNGYKMAINEEGDFRLKTDSLGKVFLQQYYEPEITLEHIKYVHQLQNLFFALCGKELELENATIKHS